MSGVSRCVIVLVAVAAIAGSGRAADNNPLLIPDWNDASLARARASFDRSGQAGAPQEQDDGRLSLPRWGLGKVIDRPTAEERAVSRSEGSLSSKLQWPKCASKVTATKHAVNAEGTWYSDSYDYGCVQIAITGSRAYAPGLSRPESKANVDDCSTSARRAPPLSTREEGDTRGRFELNLSLNGLPYSIEGSCSKGALELCRSRAAQCAIVDRLVFLGGRPQ